MGNKTITKKIFVIFGIMQELEIEYGLELELKILKPKKFSRGICYTRGVGEEIFKAQ